MSIILSGLIHLFRPLLSSLSGALDCEGLGPWYFLLGLRIVAIFFSNGPWDKAKEDVTCNWPEKEKAVPFCTALCHNRHFAISISSAWGLVFLLNLLYVGLMRLSTPEVKKEEGKEAPKEKEKDKEKDKGLAIVATAPHSGVADISTVYTVGPRGLPRSGGYTRDEYEDRDFPYPFYYPYHPYWAPWNRSPMGHMGEGYGPIVPYGPYGAGGYGGGEYGMPGAEGYGWPGAGGYSVPGNGRNSRHTEGGPSLPAEGGYGMSAEGGHGASTEGGHGGSASGGHGASASGGYGASANGGYGASASGGYGASAAGGYSAALEEAFTMPPEEGHVMPDDEGRSVPADETCGVSGNGGYSIPSDGGYSMPIHPAHAGKTKMPAPSYHMAHRKMGAGAMNSRQSKPIAPQRDTSPHHGRSKQTKATSRSDEMEQYKMPSKSVPGPISGSPYRNKYKMATRCRPDIESQVDCQGNALQPWMDDRENMALKRRQVHRNNMPSKGKGGFGSQDSNMGRPVGGPRMTPGLGIPPGPPCCGDAGCPCADNTPCCSAPQGETPTQPSGSAESSTTKPSASAPGTQEKAKKTITNLCGVPFFDIWVGLLLATEIGFLCSIIVLQMPSLLGRTWSCTPGVASCPPSVECVVRGRAEKRVALWGLVITCILFIIACSGYFYLRTCWKRACCKCCREDVKENRVEANTEPEGRVMRGDVEGGSKPAGGGQ